MQGLLQFPFGLDGVAAAVPDGDHLNVASRHGDDFCLVVYGVPQPAGSKSSFAIKAGPKGNQHYTGKVGIRDGRTKESAERHQSWRATVRESAEAVMEGREMITGPVLLFATFSLDRPKVHWLKDGSLSAEGRRHPWPDGKPDGLKLLRSVEDSLTDAGVYKDDSRIVRSCWAKEYARPGASGMDVLSRPGVVVRIRALSLY